MPTILGHVAPMAALGAGLGFKRISPRLFIAGALFAMLPDLDVVGFRFGVKYAELLGHRGLSHSLAFAFGCGVLGLAAAPWLRAGRPAAFAALFSAAASHIVLDAATSGGLGVAAFWPFSEGRYFLPWRPILVSPFSLGELLGARGAAVMMSEIKWLWLPGSALALGLRLALAPSGRTRRAKTAPARFERAKRAGRILDRA